MVLVSLSHHTVRYIYTLLSDVEQRFFDFIFEVWNVHIYVQSYITVRDTVVFVVNF